MPIEDPDWPRADQWLAGAAAPPDLVLVGVPFAAASLSPSRADLAPTALRRALSRFSTFQGEWEVDLRSLRPFDAGDLPLGEVDMWSLPDRLPALAADLPAASLTLFVGGDNAITRPLVRVAADGGSLGEVGVLTFDAHHDVRRLDSGPTNGTPIRGLIEDGLPGGNVVQVGIHSFANSAEYRAYCREQGIGVVTMEAVERRGVETVVAEALHLLASRCRRIHVDVDLDVLDRAFAPGCPGARPGGMGVRDLAAAVRRCGRDPRVASFDFVEVDPGRDPEGVTVDALATVVLAAAAGRAEREAA